MINHIDSTYAIGVDIGGTKTLIIISDSTGQVVFKDRFKTASNVTALLNLIKDSIARANVPLDRIIGMGIGVPGRVNSKEGLVMDVPSLKWQNLNLKELASKCFQLPIFINNDVNQAVIGERWLGNGKNSDNIFYIAIGTGIGGAIIANGEIVEGSSFAAGEVGYFIDKNDVQNGLSNVYLEFGTFEKKTSGTALLQKGSELGFTPAELFQEYAGGNPDVIPVIEEFVLEVSIAIANVVSVINPEIVIIGGGTANSMSTVIDKIKGKVARFSPVPIKIALSKLGGEAGALGGVAYVFQKANKL